MPEPMDMSDSPDNPNCSCTWDTTGMFGAYHDIEFSDKNCKVHSYKKPKLMPTLQAKLMRIAKAVCFSYQNDITWDDDNEIYTCEYCGKEAETVEEIYHSKSCYFESIGTLTPEERKYIEGFEW
jgi:hypothetical protein